MRLNFEHHVISFFPESFRLPTDAKGMQHAAWEIETYEELIKAIGFFKKNQVEIELTTRRVPGSNYAIYLLDKDGNRIELAFGVEKIGWQGRPKPQQLWQSIGIKGDLPKSISLEEDEVKAVKNQFNGFAEDKCTYTADKFARRNATEQFVSTGERMALPFKLSKLSYYSVISKNLDELSKFYTNAIGLETIHKSENLVMLSGRCSRQPRFFLEREGKEDKRDADAGGALTCFSTRTYSELKSCYTYLQKNGVKITKLGRYDMRRIYDELYFDLQDPSGNTIRISYSPSANGFVESEASKKSSDVLPEIIECN
jgi:catechol 2,3-dioxygenase-like lactoylglutathione lyase family enzyme